MYTFHGRSINRVFVDNLFSLVGYLNIAVGCRSGRGFVAFPLWLIHLFWPIPIATAPSTVIIGLMWSTSSRSKQRLSPK